jgi:membrane protein implicated in regulation of membrane protease activity
MVVRDMDDWVIWLLAGVAAAVGEIATTGFFLAPFSAGALAAALAALAGAGAAVTFPLFAVVTIACFAFLRPVARRHLHLPPQLRTGTAALIGRSAIVLDRIANDEGVGTVRIDGEVWSARAYDEDDVIEAGTKVQVMEIRGATALVSE